MGVRVRTRVCVSACANGIVVVIDSPGWGHNTEGGNFRPSEQTNERANERTIERASELANKQTNVRPAPPGSSPPQSPGPHQAPAHNGAGRVRSGLFDVFAS